MHPQRTISFPKRFFCCELPVLFGVLISAFACSAACKASEPLPTVPESWLPSSLFEESAVQYAAAQDANANQALTGVPQRSLASEISLSNDSNYFQLYQTKQFTNVADSRVPNNFTAFPDFNTGIVIHNRAVAMKIGGYVKADLIYDLDAIDSTDSFDTTTIIVNGVDRKNARFHARQSRLSFDTRWLVGSNVIRAFVEADFFGGEARGTSNFRFRHAYGSLGGFTAGQTWTTFTDPSAVPQTLDFEGAVSSVNRRQGLVRLELPLFQEGLTWALALEDPRVIIEANQPIDGEARTQSPDLVSRIRLERDWGNLQAAMVLRQLGFQPTGQPVRTKGAWGFNMAGSVLILDHTRGYFQVTFGEGIGSYRGSPDIVQTGPDSASILPIFGWMTGIHHEWNRRLTSNLTYSQLELDPLSGQSPDNLLGTTYLAVNLIANPYERVFWGVEYLYGIRENVGGANADAHRLQSSFGFYLP